MPNARQLVASVRNRAEREGFSNRDPDDIFDSPFTPSPTAPDRADAAIAVAYRLGALAPGQSASVNYAYILNEGDLENALGQLGAVTILQPTGTVSGSGVIFQATTDDVAATTSIDFYVDDVLVGTDLSPTFAGVFDITFNSTLIADGALTLKAVANFADGSSVETTTTVTVDNAGPAIAIAAPLPNARFVGSGIPIDVTVTDVARTPTRVSFFRESATGGSVFLGEDTTAPFSSTFSVVGLPDGETVVIRVVARDDLNRTTTLTVSGEIGEGPVANPDTVTVLQNSPTTTFDVLANDSDPDALPAEVLSISKVSTPSKGGTVTIVSGKIEYTPAAGFTGTETFNYTVTDVDGLSAIGLVTVTVIATNPPTNLTTTPASLSVPENRPVGTVVGTFATVDPDVGDTFTYTLVAGSGSTGNSAFSISGNKLLTASSFNFEAAPSYSVRIRTTDGAGLSFERAFTVNVTNVNEAPTISAIGDQFSDKGAAVGPLSFTIGDPDAGTVLTISATSSDTTRIPIGNIVFSGSGANRTVTVTPVGAVTTPVTVTVTVSDGVLTTDEQFVVSNSKQLPVVGGIATPITYPENALLLLAPAGTVTDGDSADFDTGRLTVALTTNASATDRLIIRNQGTAAGQVGVSGSNVTFGGVAIGTFTGGVGTSPLVVTFNANATPARAQAVLRNVAYQLLNENPTLLTRTVRYTVTDGDGGTSNIVTQNINIVPANDVPMIGGIVTPINYAENSLLLLAAAGTVTDGDSANFNTGRLTVALTANAGANDRLIIRSQGFAAGLVGVSGSTVSFGGLAIGTFTGGVGTTPLVVTFNGNATPTRVQAVLRNVAYQLLSENPTILTRTVRFTLTDGDGGTPTAVNQTVNIIPVNDVPVVNDIATPITYLENATLLLAPASTVTDVDSANFASGKLTVALTSNASANDRLIIRNQGTAAGLVGVSGSTVTFGGLAVGTLSGGVGTAPLVVTFNANATPTRVRAVLRNVAYQLLNDNPTILTRAARFTVSDGDGGATTVTQTINIIPVNDVPVVDDIATPITYLENATLLLAPTGTVIDVDSANFASGKLTVALTSNAGANDRVIIRNQGLAAGLVGVSGSTVTFGSLPIGTVSGGVGIAPLVVTFNANATPNRVQAVLRNVAYQLLSDNPTILSRAARFTVSDGDGGTSAAVNQTINIVPVNDVPLVGDIATPVTYLENATVLLAPLGTSVDVDSANFDTGSLTVALTSNAGANDRLLIRNQGLAAGLVGVSGSTVTFGGLAIGTVSGGVGTAPLVVTFNANATPNRVQAVLRNVAYQLLNDNPTILTRTVRFTLTDGDGGTAAAVNQTISIVPENDRPVVGGLTGPRSYRALAAPVVLAPSGTVIDVDSANFAGGFLTVSLPANGGPDDRLAIRNQGTGTGQVGVNGTTVTFQGVAIGTVSGGIGNTSPLFVAFNASATVGAVQAVFRNVTFATVSAAATASTRTVRIILADGDGDGGISLAIDEIINITVT